MTRSGIGWDSHRLEAGRPFVLGGVRIEHDHGPVGHSDADVLTHAVIDALLGAAALGTIGEHFPDTDPRFAGVSSLALLEETMRLVQTKRIGTNESDAKFYVSPWRIPGPDTTPGWEADKDAPVTKTVGLAMPGASPPSGSAPADTARRWT